MDLSRPARLPGFDDLEEGCWQRFLDSSMRLLATVNGRLIDTHKLTLFYVLLLDLLTMSDKGSARMSALADGLVLARSRVTLQVPVGATATGFPSPHPL